MGRFHRISRFNIKEETKEQGRKIGGVGEKLKNVQYNDSEHRKESI